MEERDLYSTPLKLNREELTRFRNQVLTLYWEHAGKYYFTSKNCATEALRLLKATFDHKKLYTKFKITPKGVEKGLKKLNLIKNIQQKEKPYFYSSYKNVLDKIFEKSVGSVTQLSREQFYDLSANERIEFYQNKIGVLFAAQEKHILRKRFNQLEEEVSSALHELPENSPYRKLSQQLYGLGNRLKYGTSIDSGYGILLRQDGFQDHLEQRKKIEERYKLIEEQLKEFSNSVNTDLNIEIENTIELMKSLL